MAERSCEVCENMDYWLEFGEVMWDCHCPFLQNIMGDFSAAQDDDPVKIGKACPYFILNEGWLNG